MSMPPNPSSAALTRRSPKSASVTLPIQAMASPPLALICCTVASAGSGSRSLTTIWAPSEASLRATARPMPRPEPVMSATLPFSFFTMRPISERQNSIQGHDGVTGQCREAIARSRTYLQPREPLFAFAREDFDHLGKAVNRRIKWRDGDEAHIPFPQTACRKVTGQQLAQICHREHAVCENIVHARGPGEIAVDMQKDMVVRRA